MVTETAFRRGRQCVVASQLSRNTKRYLETEHRGQHPETSRPAKGAVVRGYIVVFEGDDEIGYSAYSPDLPGVVSAAST